MASKESVTHFSQFILVKVKSNLRRSPFREKLRKLRLMQNEDFLIKRRVVSHSQSWSDG